MSETLGPRVYGENQSEVFLGRDVSTHRNLSDDTAQKVDRETTRIIEEQYSRARKVIEDNREKVEVMAKSLMEWETLDASQIDDIMAGKHPKPPESSVSSGDSGADDKPKSRKKPKIRPQMNKPTSEQP